MDFAMNMEAAVVETVESGKMTKDLAILVTGLSAPPRDKWLNTFEFIDACAEALTKKFSA